MILTETIPTVVTWNEIKAHCRLDDDTEKDLLQSYALGAVEVFERSTSFAAKTRTQTIVYDAGESSKYCNLFPLPKSPVASITSVTAGETLLDASVYELRKMGRNYYLYFTSSVSGELTVVVSAGAASAPQSVKDAVLIMTEHRRLYRGVTTGQSQSSVVEGWERICSLYGAYRPVVG